MKKNPPLSLPAAHCPFCGMAMDEGTVAARWHHGELLSLSQTKRIGAHEYTWLHAASGCYVPQLLRLPPPGLEAAA